ncbi:MAG: hypothetical protein PHX83_07210 [Acidobacteriia bacterium]|nr:hypothetical protein [Terriglobia bacterium]
MNPEERERIADGLIDEGLAHHSPVEPRPGLERRILANLAGQKPAWTWPRWAWAAASVALISAAVLFAFFIHRPQIPQHSTQAALEKPASPVTPLEPPMAPQKKTIPPGRSIRVRALQNIVNKPSFQPRLAQFPSPTPLSEQEQLLVQFLNQHHDAAVEFAKIQNQPMEDLKIEDIKIEPLSENSKPTSDEKDR